MSDLFVHLMKVRVTGERHQREEDFFTECLAATLREDSALAREILTYLCGEQKIEGTIISAANLDVETQVRLDGRPIDMLITLDKTQRIGLEHKLRAPEHRNQLSQYLRSRRSRLTRLVYIRKNRGSVPPQVAKDARYLKPKNGSRREYFLWSDLYEFVKQSAEKPGSGILNRSLLKLFDHLHLWSGPPVPDIGNLRDRNLSVQKQNRRNMKQYMVPTYDGLASGWKKVQWDDHCGVWAKGGPSNRLAEVKVIPQSDNTLAVWLEPRREADRPQMLVELSSPTFGYNGKTHVFERPMRNRTTPCTLVVVEIPFAELWGEERDYEVRSARVWDFAREVIDLVA